MEKLDHMPTTKKFGNMLGSWVIRLLTGLKIQDASSGFRAYTREAIENLSIFSRHTYTHETLVQIAFSDLAIREINVSFRKRDGGSGNSRLIKGVVSHIVRSGSTIVRTVLMYKALKVFAILGIMEMLGASVLAIRFFIFYIQGSGSGHVQSLILSSMLFNLSLITILLGFISDLIIISKKLKS